MPKKLPEWMIRDVPREKKPVIVSTEVALVPLTRDRVALIDACEAERVGSMNWFFSEAGTGYARGRARPAIVDPVFLHRFILNFPLLRVDHISGNGLDNRRKNLRFASQSENLQNQRWHNRKFKGITRRNKRWRARIRYKSKFINLGEFDSDFEAARAYDAAATDLFGKFARLNFPKEATMGFEPMMSDLQSDALATWPRRQLS